MRDSKPPMVPLWGAYAQALAVGPDVVAVGKRQQLFDRLDSDGTGQLSLAEALATARVGK